MILPRYSKATTAYSSCYTLFPQQSETKNSESKTPRLLAERGEGRELHITRVAEKALLRITKSRRTTPRNCHIFASSHHVHCNNCSKTEALKRHQWRTYISKHGYRESVSAQSSQCTRLVLHAVLLAVRTSKYTSPQSDNVTPAVPSQTGFACRPSRSAHEQVHFSTNDNVVGSRSSTRELRQI